MMAGNPNLWNMYVHPPYYHQPPPPPQTPSPSQPSALLSSSSSSGYPYFFHPQFVVGSSTLGQPCLNPPSFSDNDVVDHEQFPHSWSQLLLGGLSNEEVCHFQTKKLGNWESEEDEILNRTPGAEAPPSAIDVKPEVTSPGCKDRNKTAYKEELLFPTVMPMPWKHIMMPVSSPTSCVTSLSGGNVWDFSKTTKERRINLNSDHSSECNSTATGGACKKARVHPPSSQPPLKVRKEKLGDRITSLHQLVSPFGKTDTASVLLEGIGYIRFLQGQIEALSSPYLRNNDESGNMRSNHHSVRGEANYTFSGDVMKDSHDHKPKDLRSRGLCLVPVSCTAQVGNESGADYWVPHLTEDSDRGWVGGLLTENLQRQKRFPSVVE